MRLRRMVFQLKGPGLASPFPSVEGLLCRCLCLLTPHTLVPRSVVLPASFPPQPPPNPGSMLSHATFPSSVPHPLCWIWGSQYNRALMICPSWEGMSTGINEDSEEQRFKAKFSSSQPRFLGAVGTFTFSDSWCWEMGHGIRIETPLSAFPGSSCWRWAYTFFE